jgi:CubicO group peptidase (beta-lactamase class C family)
MRNGALWLAVLLAGCGPLDAAPGADAIALDGGTARDAAREDAPPPDVGPPPEDLEGFIDYQMERGRLPGVAAAVIVNGEVARVVTRGIATETTMVDEHTLFLVASISKTFVAALVLQLVEEGLVSLDAPAETYLGYPIRASAAPDHPVTVRELMTHTSGLIDDWLALGEATTDGDPTGTLGEFSQRYLADADHFGHAPETSRTYCNAAFGVLGAIVEAASGESLRTRSDRLFLDPLALDGAGWFLADVDRSRLADEFVAGAAGYSAQPQRGFGHYPATSMRISITGLSRWVLMHMNGGVLDGARALAESSVAEEARVQFSTLSSGQGLVWYYRNLDGERWLSHSGSSFGASADMMFRDGRGLIVITNSDAYIRSRFGRPEGDDAIEAILTRLDHEADLLSPP